MTNEDNDFSIIEGANSEGRQDDVVMIADQTNHALFYGQQTQANNLVEEDKSEDVTVLDE